MQSRSRSGSIKVPLLSRMSNKPGLVCPKCSNTRRTLISSCGRCKQCHAMTPYMADYYCGPCSHKLEACYECGQPIQDGTVYLEDVDRGIARYQSEIDTNQNKLDTCQQQYEQFKAENTESDGEESWEFHRGISWYQERIGKLAKHLNSQRELRQKLPTLTAKELIRHLEGANSNE
jgi:hypothetical protein